MTTTRIITIVVCSAFLIAYIYYKWRRTSNYVDESAKAFYENQKNRIAYTKRCQEDKRWPDFYNKLKEKYKVSLERTIDDDTYEIFNISLVTPDQTAYEPNSEGSENAGFVVYLKRKSSPKYLLVYPDNNVLMERKIGGNEWYNLFESAV
jgi:hypothetical protein